MGIHRMTLICVPPGDLNLAPPRAHLDILSAMKHSHGERTLAQTISDIEDGIAQLWVYIEDNQHLCTVVTRVVQYPNKLGCVIEYAGGESILKVIDDIKTIEDWAKERGCTDLRILGRKGWSKVLANKGYENRYTIIGKEL